MEHLVEVAKYEHLFPYRYRKLWSDWEIRTFVLCSLSLQVFLIVLAPSRKRRPNRSVRFLVWSFYLLADAVAYFALGHLADNQSDSGSKQQPGGGFPTPTNHTSARGIQREYSMSHRGGGGGGGGGGGSGGNFNSNVLAFWAPFLLLHLGGPDTITAFSLEDNELWLRHLFGLGSQLFASCYVLFRSLPHNSLLAPTLVMLLVGIIKYGERTYSLYRGSADGFRGSLLKPADAGPMYFKLMEEYESRDKAGLNPKIEVVCENELMHGTDEEQGITGQGSGWDAVEAVRSAYKFFGIFKCLVVDLVLSFQERKESRDFFLKLSPMDAFKVISVELNFLYDVLYTKTAVVHSLLGYVLRITCSAGIAASFLMFFFFRKDGFHPVDVWITYALLIGAVALDVLGFAMLVISDWTVVSKVGNHRTVRRMLTPVLECRNKKRWSEVISRLDLIRLCLHEDPERDPERKNWCLQRFRTWLGRIAKCFRKGEFLVEVIYSHRTKLKSKLTDFIFEELKVKSNDAKDLKTTRELIGCKGSLVLQNHRIKLEGDNDALEKSVETDFDESVLLWHIATDLCYYCDTEEQKGKEKEKEEAGKQTEGSGDKNKYETDDYREISKQLSDYMLYLLVMQPVLVSTVAGIGLLRYRDTCEEAKMFFGTSGLDLRWSDACKMLLSVNTDAAMPLDVKGDRSKSVLFDGCILAKRLWKHLEANAATTTAEATAGEAASWGFMNDGGKLNRKERWKVMAKVWVELLSYAACHCRGIAHARKLSTGGELLNMVWFLMAHLGLGDQFRTETGQARAKLVFEK